MPLRPNDPKKIQISDLLPGDVLLSCGPSSNELDELIKLIDQGDYSHTSLYIGMDAGNPMVVEATREGIKYDNISVDMDAQVLVDAYRFVSQDGHSFGDPDWPVQPVIDKAMSFVGGDYCYSELMLGGALVLVADESSSNPNFNALVRLGEVLLANKFWEYMQGVNAAGKVPMTCVEIAVRAFWEASATPANKYGLQVQYVRAAESLAMRSASASAVDSPRIEHWRSVREQVARAMAIGFPTMAADLGSQAGLSAAGTKSLGGSQGGERAQADAGVRPKSADGSLIVAAGSPGRPAGSFTPRDLETSPSFKFVGCLKDSNGAPGQSARN